MLASAVTTAIDALADHLMGVDGYLSADGSTASPERLAAEARMRAKEAGKVVVELVTNGIGNIEVAYFSTTKVPINPSKSLRPGPS